MLVFRFSMYFLIGNFSSFVNKLNCFSKFYSLACKYSKRENVEEYLIRTGNIF